MNSSQIENRIPNFYDKAINLVNFPQIDSQKAMTTIKHRMAVQKAIEIIEAKMQDLPTLAELGSLSGLSRTYFSQVFKETTGMKLQEYITEVRLKKAKNLLSNIDLKIKEVAYETGFKDPNYFCRTFKRKMGLNPTNWRVKKLIKSGNRN